MRDAYLLKVYKCLSWNESGLFDKLNTRPEGRAGQNVYRREVLMPPRERRRGGGRCSIANSRLNSICEHGCAVCNMAAPYLRDD